MLTFLILLVLPAQAKDIVRYQVSEKYSDPNQAYFIDMLELALRHSTEEFGEYQLEPQVIEMSQERASVMIARQQKIDVTWRMTSAALEQTLQAVYIPLIKGLMGYRVFIIRKQDQGLFDENMSLEKLKLKTAGQGYDWPDTKILRFNGFKVSAGSNFNLLTMLIKLRFDYFPRALHEPWLEIIDKNELMVEPKFLLRYPAPLYFFVNKDSQRLHQRLTSGLNNAIASGEFDAFFYRHPISRDIRKKAGLAQRTIFDLINPLLSKESLKITEAKSFWFDAEKPQLPPAKTVLHKPVK